LVIRIFVEKSFSLGTVLNRRKESEKGIVLHGIQIQLNSALRNFISEVPFTRFSDGGGFYIVVFLEKFIDDRVTGDGKFVLRHVVMNSEIPAGCKKRLFQMTPVTQEFVKNGIMALPLELSSE